MEQNEGIKSFLQKAAQQTGVEFNNDKADSLIKSYNGDYSKLITDVGRKIGIDDNTMPEFTNRARKTYGIPESTFPSEQTSEKTDLEYQQDWVRKHPKLNALFQKEGMGLLNDAYIGTKKMIGSFGTTIDVMAENLGNNLTGGYQTNEKGEVIAPWEKEYKQPGKSDFAKKIEQFEKEVPASKGGLTAFFGQMLPQVTGLIATTLLRNKSVSEAYLASMYGTSFGSGIENYDKHIKETGETPNANDRNLVGIGYGAAEYLGEKVGLDYFMPKGYGKLTSGAINPIAAKEIGKSVIENYAKLTKQSAPMILKKIIAGSQIEGGQEVATEGIDIAIDKWITGENVTGEDVKSRLIDAYKGGVFMSAGVMPFAHISQNASTTQRRRQQGKVTIGIDEQGLPLEIIKTENGIIGIRPNGDEIDNISEQTIKNSATFKTEDFEKTMSSLKKGSDVLSEDWKDKSIEQNLLNSQIEGQSIVNDVPKRVQAKKEFEQASTSFNNIQNPNYTKAVNNILSTYTDPKEIITNFNKVSNEVGATGEEYDTALKFISSSVKINSLKKAKQADIQKVIDNFSDNEGNVTSATIEGEKYYIKNTADLGQPGKIIFAKNQAGEVKPFNSVLVKDWSTLSPDQIQQTAQQKEAEEDNQFDLTTEVNNAAAQIGIKPEGSVKTPNGIAKVVSVNNNGTVTVVNQKGLEDEFNIDEVEAYKTDEQKQAEKDALAQQKENEKIQAQQIEEEAKQKAEMEKQAIEKQTAEAESDIPRDKEGNPDYDAMDPETFYNEYAKEFSEEEAKAEIQDMQRAIVEEIKKKTAKKSKATSANERASINREIKNLNTRLDNINSVLQKDRSKVAGTDTKWIAENSTDANEIASAYQQEQENAPVNNLQEWQKYILGVKFNPDSFNRFGDKNNVTSTLAKTWLRNDGHDIDQFIRDNFEDVPGFENVTEQDVIDFITENPSGQVRKTTDTQNPSGQVRKTTDTQNQLRKRYREITGVSIDNHKLDQETLSTQAKLESFLKTNGLNDNWFSIEDLQQLVTENKDKLSENDYNEFTDYLSRELTTKQAELDEWDFNDAQPSIQTEISASEDSDSKKLSSTKEGEPIEFSQSSLLNEAPPEVKSTEGDASIVYVENIEEQLAKLDNKRQELLIKVEPLVELKKKLYSNVDIESPKSEDEKRLEKQIASIFSEIQSIILEKRKIVKQKNENKQSESEPNFRVQDKSEAQQTIEYLQSIDKSKRNVIYLGKSDIIQYLEDNRRKYSRNTIDQVKNANFSAFYLRDEIFINSDKVKTKEDVLTNWIHERVHAQTKELYDREYLSQLYDQIGFKEIQRVVPPFYWMEKSYIQADEYISFASEKLSANGKLDDKIPSDIQNIILNIVTNITSINNLTNGKNNLDNFQQGIEGRNAHVGDSDRRGTEQDRTDSEGNGVGSRTRLQYDEKGSKVTFSDQANIDLKDRHNALASITKIGAELNIPVNVVNSSELTSDNGQIALTNNGTVTIVSDRVKSVSEVIKALVKEVASENGIRKVLANADPNSIVGKQLAKFDELSPEELQSDKLAQVIRKAFRLTSNQFTQDDLNEIVGNQKEKPSNTNVRFRIEDQSKIIQDARKYSDFNDFVDAYKNADFRDAHSAPGNSKSGLTIEERMDQGDDFNLVEVVQGFSTQPQDYFDPRNGARWYGYDDKEGMQSYFAIRSVMNDINSQIREKGEITKTPKIKAYRAVPKTISESKLIDRDWITFSKEYAKGHGENRFGEGEYKIISQSVPADHVWWDGNDINEWGYDTGQTETLGRSDLKKIWDEVHGEARFRILGETGASNLDKSEEVTTRLDNLAIAREMEQAGKDAKSIRLATGWEKGVDGKWRYETDDSGITFKRDVIEELKNNQKLANKTHEFRNLTYRKNEDGSYDFTMVKKGATSTSDIATYRNIPNSELEYIFDNNTDLISKVRNGEGQPGLIGAELDESAKELKIDFEHYVSGGQTLASVIENKELFKEYPELKNVIVVYDPNYSSEGSLGGDLDGQSVITVKSLAGNRFKSTLLHEIQHKIQDLEGFARGGNTEMFTTEQLFQKAKQLDLLGKGFTDEQIKHKAYQALAGEVESRNVQTRMNMTPEERLNTLLSETEDVSREDQIVIFDGLGMNNMSEETKPFKEIFQERHLAIQDLKDSGVKRLKVNSDGTVSVYHGTSSQNWEKIQKEGFKEGSFFSVSKSGTEYGDSPLDVAKRKFGKDGMVVEVKIDPRDLSSAAAGSELYSEKSLVPKGGYFGSQIGLMDGLGVSNLEQPFTKYLKANDVKTGQPVTLTYLKNTEKAPYLGDRFGQNVEPSGFYFIQKEHEFSPSKGWIEGQITLNNPLVIPLTDENMIEYKNELSEQYKGKKKKALTNALKADGYDGIITTKDGYLGEMIKFDFDPSESDLEEQIPSTITVNGVERPTTNSKGQVIHPTLEGIENFWKWFGDSKVVDKDGRPLVVYHGTKSEFYKFETDKQLIGWLGKGFYFTKDKSDAKNYGRKILNSYLKIENPFVIETDKINPDGSVSFAEDVPAQIKNAYKNFSAGNGDYSIILKENGHDGIIWGSMITTFSPNQIKSATGNNGSFSNESDDIRFRIQNKDKIIDFVNLRAYNTQSKLDTDKLLKNGYEYIDKAMPNITKDDYFISTKGNFERVSRDEWSKLDSPITRSDSGSSYKLDGEYIYRASDHWGRVASCDWNVNSNYYYRSPNYYYKNNDGKEIYLGKNEPLTIGKIKLSDLKRIPSSLVRIDKPEVRFRVATSQQELDDFVKDSKIKETVYHGTNTEFDEFKKTNDIGFHFTPHKSVAQGMSIRYNDNTGERENGYVKSVKINLKNPAYIPDLKNWTEREIINDIKGWNDYIEENGKDKTLKYNYDYNLSKIDNLKKYAHIANEMKGKWEDIDGFIYINEYERVPGKKNDSYIVLHPDQILIQPQDDIRFRIDKASEGVNTNPTDAQKEAGNYKKGHIKFDGFDISIENPKGSTRSGVGTDGESWEAVLPADYGYFRGTVGKDKDHIDVFIGDKPEIDKVYVVDQIDPKTGKFDEHKVMLGFDGVTEARKTYQAAYSKGWNGLQDITRTTKEGLKDWFENGNTKKPFADSEVRFKKEPIQSPIGFYSPTEKALSAIQQEKGTVVQFEKMLLDKGAKQAELDWMGWSQQFPSVNAKITKTDIQNWIDQNRIEVEEVEKGKIAYNQTPEYREIENKSLENSLKQQELQAKWWNSNLDEDFEALQQAKNEGVELARQLELMGKRQQGENVSKYSQYTTPGGSNYRELLLTMPEKRPATTASELEAQSQSDYRKPYRELSEIQKKEIEKQVLANKGYTKDYSPKTFKSSHFDEPNILAHVRFNEREVNGEKVLFIEEWQADKGQEWQKLKKLIDSGKATQADIDRYNFLDKNFPFNKTSEWLPLAMRRMMRYAAENGFDRIAWTNGEQQAERYDLSKSIDKVYYNPNTKEFGYFVKGEKTPEIKTKTEPTDIENYIGKDATKKLLDSPLADDMHEIEGNDLKVGGEGMKAFYNAIVPSAANKLGKPFGARVENVDITTDANLSLSNKEILNQGKEISYDKAREVISKKDANVFLYTIDNNKPYRLYDFNDIVSANNYWEVEMKNRIMVQSLPVTESMKESVMEEGIPMFRIEDKLSAVRDIRKLSDIAFRTTQKNANTVPESKNAETEAAMNKAHGLKGETMKSKIDRWKEEIKETTQHFKHVTEKEFPQVYNDLRLFESIPEVVKKDAYDKISNIIKPIVNDKNQYKAFERYIVIADLMHDVKSGLYTNTIGIKEAAELRGVSEDEIKKLIESKDIKIMPHEKGERYQLYYDSVLPGAPKSDIYKELPFNMKSVDELQDYYNELRQYVKANPDLQEVIANRNSLIYKVREQLIENGLMAESARDNTSYFHHMVMKFREEPKKNTSVNQSYDLRVHPKGWQKARTGSMEDYNTDYIQSEFEVIAQSLEQLAVKKSLQKIGQTVDIMPSLVAQANNEGGSWRNYIPEGYTTWHPKPGTNAWAAASIAEKAIQSVIEGNPLAESLNEQLAEADQTLWVIPSKIAAQLDEMKVSEKEILPVRGMKFFNSTWKQWILLNPARLMKYMINNLSGDLDIVFAYNPKILLPKYSWTAAKELYFEAKGEGMSKDMKEAIENAVISSGLSIQEIPDVNKEGVFKTLTGDDNFFQKYWNSATSINDFRESMLRLAAYKFFKEELNAGKKHHGASNPKAVDALRSNEEKAGKMARELLGDYGNLSQGGMWLRSHAYPFWSWMEINAPRYYKLLRNTYQDSNSTKQTLGVAARKTALSTTALAARVMLLAALVTMWNRLFFPDEDDELTKTGNRQLRLITGRRDDGSIITLRIQGAFSDVLSFVGLEDAFQDVKDVRTGKTTVGKKVKEAGSAFVNRVGQGAMPFERLTGELLTGKSAYPDILHPRPIIDRAEHAFRMVSLDKVYRFMTKKPLRKGGKELIGLVLYETDPGEAAYYAMRQRIYDFLDEKEYERPSGDPTEKSIALRYYKQAKKFKDTKLENHWWAKYKALGGTKEGMRMSIKKGEVTSALPKEYKREFLDKLDGEDREVLQMAEKWYDETYK